MKLDAEYDGQGIEVMTHEAHFTAGDTRVIKYTDPLEALDDAAAMLQAAVGFMRNKYEQAWVIADAEVPVPQTDLIDARLYPAQRQGDTYYITRVPRVPAPRFVELDGRTFQREERGLVGREPYRYNEVEVYGAQERGSGGSVG